MKIDKNLCIHVCNSSRGVSTPYRFLFKYRHSILTDQALWIKVEQMKVPLYN